MLELKRYIQCFVVGPCHNIGGSEVKVFTCVSRFRMDQQRGQHSPCRISEIETVLSIETISVGSCGRVVSKEVK